MNFLLAPCCQKFDGQNLQHSVVTILVLWTLRYYVLCVERFFSECCYDLSISSVDRLIYIQNLHTGTLDADLIRKKCKALPRSAQVVNRIIFPTNTSKSHASTEDQNNNYLNMLLKYQYVVWYQYQFLRWAATLRDMTIG